MSVKDFVFMIFGLFVSLVVGVVSGTVATLNFRGTFFHGLTSIDPSIWGAFVGVALCFITFVVMKDKVLGFKFCSEKPQ